MLHSVYLLKCYPIFYWISFFFFLSSCLIKMFHPHSVSYMAYYIQTGDMSTVFSFLWVMDRQRWYLQGKDVWFYQFQRGNMPEVAGRTVCLPAESDGQTAGVASLRILQIALSLCIPGASLPAQRHNGWPCFVTMYVWGKQRFSVKPAWFKAVHYRLKRSSTHVLIMYH